MRFFLPLLAVGCAIDDGLYGSTDTLDTGFAQCPEMDCPDQLALTVDGPFDFGDWAVLVDSPEGILVDCTFSVNPAGVDHGCGHVARVGQGGLELFVHDVLPSEVEIVLTHGGHQVLGTSFVPDYVDVLPGGERCGVYCVQAAKTLML